MNYSIRNLVIAGGLAIAAIAAVLIYTSNVQQAAKEGQARVKVMVARVDIPAGTPAKDIIARGDLIQQEIVQDDQLPGVLTTTDGLSGNVLKQDLYTGQQVSSQVFVPTSEAASTVAIRGTTRAVGVDVKTSNGLVGTLKDGDHVDVYAEIGGGNSRIVRKVLTNVLVLNAQIGVKDPDDRERRRAHPVRAQRPRRPEDDVARRQRRQHVLAGTQRPQEERTQLAAHGRDAPDRARRRPPGRCSEADQGPPQPGRSDSVSDAIRIFISGSCAGLAEVRQALSSHDAIKVVGTAVDAPSAGDRLREESVDVLLHGSSRGDRLPTQDIHTLQSASPAPIVIVTSGCTPEFLQEALAHGVQDVAILPQLTESLVFTLRRAHVLNHNAARPQAQATGPARSGGEGRVITVFSPKGGVGKSTISTGLSGAYCHGLKRSTLLIDLDLQFGDVGIMMGIDPAQTIVDLVTTTGELDPDKLGGYVVHHPSGMDVLCAPLRPEDAELVTEDRIGQLIDVAKSAYDMVVLDTPPHFDATTLAALDRSDRLVLVATMDIPTVKNCKLALQTLNLLQYPRERIALVVNRPLGRADLREERHLAHARHADLGGHPARQGDRDRRQPRRPGHRVGIALARRQGDAGARGVAAAPGLGLLVQGRQCRGQGCAQARRCPCAEAAVPRPAERPEGRHVQVLQVEGQEGGVN